MIHGAVGNGRRSFLRGLPPAAGPPLGRGPAYVRKLGVLLVGALIGGMSLVVPTAAAVVVHADGGYCSDRVPVDALAGSTLGFGGANGALSVGTNLYTNAGPLVTGVSGAAAPAASIGAAGTVGLAAVVFFASAFSTCKFIDWIVGDYRAIPPPDAYVSVVGDTAATWSTNDVPGNCVSQYGVSQSLIDTVAGTGPNWTSGGGFDADVICRKLTLPDAPGALYPSPWQFGVSTSGTTTLADGNSIAGTTMPSTYPYGLCFNQCPVGYYLFWVSEDGTRLCRGQLPTGRTNVFGGSTGPCSVPLTELVTVESCGSSKGQLATGQFDRGEVVNPGGVCGRLPGQTFYGATAGPDEFNRSQPPTVFSPIKTRDELSKQKGWQRFIETQVRCQYAGWMRVKSPYYWDKEVSQRIPMATCPDGDLMLQINVWRITKGFRSTMHPNYEGCELGNDKCAVGTGTSLATARSTALIFRWVAPTTWVTSPPVFRPCLINGNECGGPTFVTVGEPPTQTEICMWGGIEVAASFCDPQKQTGPAPNPVPGPGSRPRVAPIADPTPQLVPVPNPDGDMPTTEEPDPYEPETEPTPSTTIPGPQSGIRVPIDDDGEETRRPELGDDKDICWPTGFGWFNPVLWVLRPIKCALEWAFVPSDETVDGLMDSFGEIGDKAPFAYLGRTASYMADAFEGGQSAIVAGRGGCIPIIPILRTMGNTGEVVTDGEEACPSVVAGSALTQMRTVAGAAFWVWALWNLFNMTKRVIHA